MDRAEAFIFTELNLSTGILFCLPELVPFYAKRGWSLVENPSHVGASERSRDLGSRGHASDDRSCSTWRASHPRPDSSRST